MQSPTEQIALLQIILALGQHPRRCNNEQPTLKQICDQHSLEIEEVQAEFDLFEQLTPAEKSGYRLAILDASAATETRVWDHTICWSREAKTKRSFKRLETISRVDFRALHTAQAVYEKHVRETKDAQAELRYAEENADCK